MKFMELTYRQRSHTGGADILEKFMKDMEGSGWEIYDRGTDSANWVNNHMGMNHHVAENYTELKECYDIFFPTLKKFASRYLSELLLAE